MRRGGNCFGVLVDGFLSTTEAGGYGSWLSPGRRRGETCWKLNQ
jgi:hypothetical protein